MRTRFRNGGGGGPPQIILSGRAIYIYLAGMLSECLWKHEWALPDAREFETDYKVRNSAPGTIFRKSNLQDPAAPH